MENKLNTDFEYLNLAEVNPDIPNIPEGSHDFQIISAERNKFTYKQDNPERGITAGDEASYIKFGLAVINDAENAGRRVYQTLFPDNKTPRALRLLMDATGITQTSGMSLDEWLKSLVTERATFAAPTFNKINKKTEKEEVIVKFTAAQPVA